MLVLNRCIPTSAINGTINFVNENLNAQEISSQVLEDFIGSWYYILGSVGLAVGLGFLWLLLMRICAGVIVWLTILVVYLVLFGITIFFVWAGIQKLYIVK